MLLAKVIRAFPVKEITMVKVSLESNKIPTFKPLGCTLNRYLTRIKEIYFFFPYTLKADTCRMSKSCPWLEQAANENSCRKRPLQLLRQDGCLRELAKHTINIFVISLS